MSYQPTQAEPVRRCDNICLKDYDHVERGEPHFYGYENPSPRQHLTGIWFVYSKDLQVCPMFISDDELIARRFQERVGYFTHIEFWEFGTEWSE